MQTRKPTEKLGVGVGRHAQTLGVWTRFDSEDLSSLLSGPLGFCTGAKLLRYSDLGG